MRHRAGILGQGYMGSIRRAELARRSDVEIARAWHGEDASWREVAEDRSLDVIFVCLPSHLTCEAVCLALEAGKHVLAEKPPGTSVDEVRRMIAAEARSGRALKFGFNHRYHPAVRAAERRIAEGDLGALVWARGRYGKPMDEGFASSWRAERARAGGGIFLDQGIHMLDLVRSFSGPIAEVKAFASASASAEVEDDLVAILRSEAGALGVLHSSHTQRPPLFSLELGFAEGTLSIEGLLSKSGRYGPERLRCCTRSEERTETFARDDSWALEIDELLECARTGAPVRVGSSAEALELMMLVEAIYASAGVFPWTSSSST